MTRMLLSLALISTAWTGLSAQNQDLAAFLRDAAAAHAGVASERLALERDRIAVGRAKALRLPTLSLEAMWVEQQGGVDIGDLINPAFAALNDITATDRFPTDVSFRFPLKQDARARLALPLFDAAIPAAVAATAAARDAQEARFATAERDLTIALQVGLTRHAAAVEVVRLRQATLAALDEQVRATERRAAAGLDAPDVVLRARADRAEAAQQVLEAERSRDAARRAMNRLARRPLDAELPTVTDTSFVTTVPASLDQARQHTSRRSELEAADAAMRQAGAGRAAALAPSLPTVNLALDYGFQGNRWRFSNDNDFTQMTVQARWTPFTSGRNSRRRAEAALEAERATLARQDVHEQLRLEVEDAWDAVNTAEAALRPATEREAAAARTLDLVRRRWDEGLASHLELVSAQASATAAHVSAILARYQLAEQRILLAKAIATVPSIR
ncbi:MAG: TolC family protein [Gemmatimonadales bacterium]